MSIALLLAGLAVPQAQGAEPQTAEQLLNTAQLQFQNRDFVTARETLWQAYEKRRGLGKQQLKMLADLLGEVDAAIDKQVLARATYNRGLKAFQAGDLAAAKTAFEESAQCPYLKAAVRAEAKKHLADVQVKLAEQLAQQNTAGETIVLAEEATVERPEGTKVAAVDEETPAADTVEGAVVEEPEPLSDAVADDADAVIVEETTIITEEEPADAADDDAGDVDTVIVEDTVVDTEPDAPALSKLQARKIQADEAVARGKSALEKNQPAKAVQYFQQALKLDPENMMAKRQLNYARELTGRHGEAGTLSDLQKSRRIQQQMAVQKYEKAMDRSMELMSDPNNTEAFENAKQAVIIARNAVKTNKRLFTESEYDQRVAEANERLDWIERKQDEYNRSQAIATAEELVIRRRQAAIEQSQEKQRKISDLTQRYRQLISERRLEEALNVIMQVEDLDPDNNWAKETIPILRQTVTIQREKEAVQVADMENIKTSIALRYADVPWYDRIRYPKDWPALSAARQRYAADAVTESPESRRVRDLLQQRIPQLNFGGVPLSDVIQFLREVTGANIWVNWRALEAAGVDKSTPVNINLSDIAAERALKTILEDVGGGTIDLSYVISESVVQISTREDLNRQTETRVYDIRDLVVRVQNFVGPRVDLDMGDEGDDGDGGSVGGTGLFDGDSDEDDDTEEEMSRAEMIEKVRSMITETIDPFSWRPEGEIGSINELNGNLIVTQTAENHRRVGDLIAKLREARTIQISVEARFLTVNTGFLNQIGVDLDFYFNLGSDIGPDSSAYPTAAVTPYNNYLRNQVAGSSTTAVPTRGASIWSQAGHSVSGSGSNFSPISANTDWSWANILGTNGTTTVVNGIGGEITNPTMAIAGTFLDDIQVDFLINATQAHKTSRILTAPRVTMMSGQQAYVTVSTQRAYVSDAEPVVADDVALYDPTISYVPTGTVLDVEATASHDRRYVIMTIKPQVVQLVQLRTTFISAGLLFGGVEVGLPEIIVQDIQTTCSVPDGGTLLLGGQRLSHKIEREMGVPVISKLPVLNRAFTNRGKIRDEQTLLIMVKPTILIQDEVERDPHRYTASEPFEPGFGRYD
ncbi:MAG: tetratricopeptide repeat protein [Planctomycetes bacterium]|nr:tetratricopeptide repeat protein [Planctomycetota bacterium]